MPNLDKVLPAALGHERGQAWFLPSNRGHHTRHRTNKDTIKRHSLGAENSCWGSADRGYEL